MGTVSHAQLDHQDGRGESILRSLESDTGPHLTQFWAVSDLRLPGVQLTQTGLQGSELLLKWKYRC